MKTISSLFSFVFRTCLHDELEVVTLKKSVLLCSWVSFKSYQNILSFVTRFSRRDNSRNSLFPKLYAIDAWKHLFKWTKCNWLTCFPWRKQLFPCNVVSCRVLSFSAGKQFAIFESLILRVQFPRSFVWLLWEQQLKLKHRF